MQFGDNYKEINYLKQFLSTNTYIGKKQIIQIN